MAVTNSREIRNLRASLKLSNRQKNILIGSLLGDGCLTPNQWNKNYRFQVEQNESHAGYVNWLYKEFQEWVLSKPVFRSYRDSWRFRTISHPELTGMHHEFYSGNVKILPGHIKELLNNPLSLAIWAMDDGCLMTRGDGFTFNTQSFSKKENEKLRECLAENFGLSHTSLHRDKNKFRIYVRTKSLNRLCKLIKAHILPEFIYKLPIAP